MQARGVQHPKRPRSVFQQHVYSEQPAKESKKHAGLTHYQVALTRGMQLLTSAAGLDAEPEDAKEPQPAPQHVVQTKLSSNVSRALPSHCTTLLHTTWLFIIELYVRSKLIQGFPLSGHWHAVPSVTC